jgi:hypothetical protein
MVTEDWGVGSSRQKDIRAGQPLLTFEGLMQYGPGSLLGFHSTAFECWPYPTTRVDRWWGEWNRWVEQLYFVRGTLKEH